MVAALFPARLAAAPDAERPATLERDARLRRIVECHHAFLWRSLRRLGVDEALVDDAAQAVLLVVARRLSEIERGAERSFVFQTALRVASDHRRARARRPPTASLDDASEEPSPDARPDEIVERSQQRAHLDQLLDELDADLRTVFVLFELEELSLTEIAEIVGIPRGTAASRLRRAQETFEAAARRFQLRLGHPAHRPGGAS